MRQIFDMLDRLIQAAGHPDITGTYRYGDSETAVAVTYASGAKAFVWPADKAKATPVDLPDDPGDYRARVGYLLRLLVDLLDTARPDGWVWRTVGVEGVDLAPCGLEIRAGGTSVVVRVTAGGAPGPDTDPESFAGWALPSLAL